MPIVPLLTRRLTRLRHVIPSHSLSPHSRQLVNIYILSHMIHRHNRYIRNTGTGIVVLGKKSRLPKREEVKNSRAKNR
jgi:hypothetical protein